MTNPKEALKWYERKRVEARAMADRDCNNCKHNKPDGCSRWDCEYEPVMSDLIKKSDAIKALYKYSFVSKNVIEREINAIPSAEPLVWSDEDASWKCGRCDCVFEEIDWKPNYNFCPNCGAKMVREDGEA